MIYGTSHDTARNGRTVNTTVELLQHDDEPFEPYPWRVVTRIDYRAVGASRHRTRNAAAAKAARMQCGLSGIERRKGDSMRLHTDTLNRADLYAALPRDVHAEISEHGSRKRDHAFEVYLYVYEKDALHSRYGNSGTFGRSDTVAATWDEWGVWMAALYEIDPQAVIGWYDSHAAFLAETKRYRDYVRETHAPQSLAWRTHTAPWLDAVAVV